MSPPDLLRVGEMVLAKGAWQGRQIVPADWLERSTTPGVVIEGPRRYGWHWYVRDLAIESGRTQRMVSAIGWGGQRLHLVPGLDLAVAMNCGNYSRSGREQTAVVTALLNEVVLPSIT
jgi:CubicO group peptidase (beta-lactamase class C family)